MCIPFSSISGDMQVKENPSSASTSFRHLEDDPKTRAKPLEESASRTAFARQSIRALRYRAHWARIVMPHAGPAGDVGGPNSQFAQCRNLSVSYNFFPIGQLLPLGAREAPLEPDHANSGAFVCWSRCSPYSCTRFERKVYLGRTSASCHSSGPSPVEVRATPNHFSKFATVVNSALNGSNALEIVESRLEKCFTTVLTDTCGWRIRRTS